MVEPRTRSRDLVEAVVRGRQVMSACIVAVLAHVVTSRMNSSPDCNVVNPPTQLPHLVELHCMLQQQMPTLPLLLCWSSMELM